jgi:hypothetical protein
MSWIIVKVVNTFLGPPLAGFEEGPQEARRPQRRRVKFRFKAESLFKVSRD